MFRRDLLKSLAIAPFAFLGKKTSANEDVQIIEKFKFKVGDIVQTGVWNNLFKEYYVGIVDGFGCDYPEIQRLLECTSLYKKWYWVKYAQNRLLRCSEKYLHKIAESPFKFKVGDEAKGTWVSNLGNMEGIIIKRQFFYFYRIDNKGNEGGTHYDKTYVISDDGSQSGWIFPEERVTKIMG